MMAGRITDKWLLAGSIAPPFILAALYLFALGNSLRERSGETQAAPCGSIEEAAP